MSKIIVCVVLVAAVAAFVVAGAEEEPKPADPKAKALELVDKGRAALVADKGREAIDCLQKAISIIQASVQKGFASFLPMVSGWTRSKPKTASGSWGAGGENFQWTTVSADYLRESDGLKVEVTITSSPQMIEPQRAMLDMYKSPQMRKMLEMDKSKKFEFIEEGVWGGWIVTDETNSTLMAVAAQVMVGIDIRKPMADVVRAFWEAMDRKGLAGGK